jgi:uncharacterized protein YfiM (DUF2279 family)
LRRRAGAFLAAILAAVLVAPAARAGAEGPAAAETLSEGSFAESFAEAIRPHPSRPDFALVQAAPPDLTSTVEPPQPKWIWIGVGAALAIGGSAVSAYTEEPRFPWHFTDEGWFGQNTYVGGADKASHFVSYYAVQRLATEYNQAFHLSRNRAAWVATAESFLAGLMTEIGDGTNKFGFSWQDLTMDTLGAFSGLAIVNFGLDDLIGFRAGWVPGAPNPDRGGLGRDYSSEIYTFDLKFQGLGKRACFNPGPAKYLLFSITYGTKGYPYDDPSLRERQLGLEIGINFAPILEALKVPREKWWGVVLYTLFDIVRFPYTAIGWRYDLNHDKWIGPDTGNTYPTGGLKPVSIRR